MKIMKLDANGVEIRVMGDVIKLTPITMQR